MGSTGIEWTDSTWRPVPGFPEYQVAPGGRVASTKGGRFRLLRPIVSKSGHLYVFMYRDGRQHKVWVHRAILTAFVREPRGGEECRHLDGDSRHNDVNNLAWGSRQENTDDKKRHGTLPVGERSGTRKLTEQDVLAIRKQHGKRTLRDLAQEYGVSHTAVRRAALGLKWGHLREASVQ